MELMDTTNLQKVKSSVKLKNTSYKRLAYNKNTTSKTTIGLRQRSLHTRGRGKKEKKKTK